MSREIDALVAERIFGYRVYPDGKMNKPAVDSLFEIPLYSTKIEEAFKVVHKLRSFRFQLISNSSDSCAWFGNHCGTWQRTEPLTICMAALKASEVEFDFDS